MAKNTRKAKVTAPVLDETAIMALEMITAPEAIEVPGAEVTAEDAAPEVVEVAVEAIEALPTVTEEVVEAPADAQISFEDMLGAISNTDCQAAAIAITKAIDERAAFELANGNDNIQKTLKKAREALSFPSVAAVLLACGVDEAFINRSIHDGKRYNVYALGKLADQARALSGGSITNKINHAVMRTLFNAKRAGVAFTGEIAKAAASDKIRVTDNAIKAILVRHTVSSVTAATQASSTMQALETLGVVQRSGGKNPTYTLTDHPAVAKLEKLLAA